MEIPTPKQSKGDWREDETWRVKDGVLHLNPAHLEFAHEALKVKSNIDEEIEDGVTQLNIEEAQECSNKNNGHKTNLEDHVVMHMLGAIMEQQYSIQMGIKLFGDEGRKSVSKELQQLHTYEPVHAHELTREQRLEALSSLMFMTQKRCRKVKSRACVNGSKQRQWIKKEDAASPTVMTDNVMLTSLIEAHEYRKVITLDIPGAFLHTNIDEEVVMLLCGELAVNASNFELTKMVVWLGKKYGEKIVVHRGDVHDYLGMDLDYSEKGVVKLSMIKQREKVFADFPEDVGKASSTPASDHLFQVRDAEETKREGKYLPADKVSQFHHTMAQLLFICCHLLQSKQGY
jgi:hypothetical protein